MIVKKNITLSESEEFIAKIRELIEREEISSISEFYRHALLWFFIHQEEIPLVRPLGLKVGHIFTISLSTNHIAKIASFLSIQPYRINRSEFIRCIADLYYNATYSTPISHSIESPMMPYSDPSKIEIPGYKTFTLGRKVKEDSQ